MILIVDDKPENIFSLKKILELNGYEVDTAGSGEDALKKILKESYELIILDVQMPVMDGFEVADAVSGFSKAKDIPIIFLSAVNTEKRFIAKGYDSGGIDYITKPVDPDILILKVRTFLKLYRQTKELNDTKAALEAEVDSRKRAQEELKDKVEEQHSILESIPQIAFMVDKTGAIEYVNARWFDYSLSPGSFPHVHPEDEPLESRISKAIADNTALEADVRLRELKEGSYRSHLLRMVPAVYHGIVVKWVGTFTDVHLQKSAADELERHVSQRTKDLMEANKELEARNFDLQQFASVASHDLKEPLRKIQVFSSIIKDKYAPDFKNGADAYIQRIIDSSERMSGLINDLLNYSRLSVAELFRPTNLNALINTILQDLEITIREKNAVVQVSMIPELEVIPGQMRQVFQNIISNALKFSRKEIDPVISVTAEIVEDMEITSNLYEDGCCCRISISDNGIGFNEKYLDKIFTLFQRLNARELYEGTGIGLAIAKRIIEKHNGILTARSRENEGSTFIIVLPLKQQMAERTLSSQNY